MGLPGCQLLKHLHHLLPCFLNSLLLFTLPALPFILCVSLYLHFPFLSSSSLSLCQSDSFSFFLSFFLCYSLPLISSPLHTCPPPHFIHFHLQFFLTLRVGGLFSPLTSPVLRRLERVKGHDSVAVVTQFRW